MHWVVRFELSADRTLPLYCFFLLEGERERVDKEIACYSYKVSKVIFTLIKIKQKINITILE